jgi:Transposase DDE domain group 1
MAKRRKNNIRKTRRGKGFTKKLVKAKKINASTRIETCDESLSPFGGLLAVVKFLELVQFEQIFDADYTIPSRNPAKGHYFMVKGILMLLFIGFNRLWHFSYIRFDSVLCGIFNVVCLPVASTWWRYLDSMGINQAISLVNVMSRLRERMWQVCGLNYKTVKIDIDTTVETVYGDQQGARIGHNPRQRGKKGYRPVLGFIYETREYLSGKLRRGETLSGKETADYIRKIRSQLPSCVRHALIRADGEFCSWESVKAATEERFEFIFANKSCKPFFDPDTWHRPWKRRKIEFNSCVYQPQGWEIAVRFVAMRIPIEETKSAGKQLQCRLFEEDRYKYRIFCTNLNGPAHKIIDEYDIRADVENLVGEAKREGLAAIPSSKFKNNYAFFQLVMLSYNIWRYIKLVASMSSAESKTGTVSFQGTKSNTIRIARLKLLFVAAKVVKDAVKYSLHDTRTPALLGFYDFMDRLREKQRPWELAPA